MSDYGGKSNDVVPTPVFAVLHLRGPWSSCLLLRRC